MSNDLTASEIKEFLDPWAFMRPREKVESLVTADGKELPLFGESELLTTTLSQSVNVLTSAYDRLETILGNLATMKQLSEEAARSRDSVSRDEAYAKLRSLTAGIDIIVDQSRFNHQRMLDGSGVTLASTMNGKTSEPGLANLLTFGEGSLEISEYTDTSRVTLFFGEGASMLNGNKGRLGIEIMDAQYSEPTDPEEELEDGEYRLKIDYAGENSTVYLTDQALDPIATIENVDLSGDQIREVDFGNGVKITIDATTIYSPSDYDKWDYENKGPTAYFADVDYRRVSQQTLLVDSNEKLYKDANLIRTSPAATEDGGELRIQSFDYNASGLREGALEAGNYSVKINYFGEYSTVSVKDERGVNVALKTGVDLSAQGMQSIDMGNGLVINFQNDGAGMVPDEVTATLSITESENTKTRSAQMNVGTSYAAESATGELFIESISAGAKPSAEDTLALGTYSIELRYLGANSMATIRDADGNMVDFVSGLDLSAEGENIIDLGNGIEITVNNDHFIEGNDKATATFTLKETSRKDNHEAQDTSASAEVLRSQQLTDDAGGTLEITSAMTSALASDAEALPEDDYTVEILYFGKYSMATLTNSAGERLEYGMPVDLSAVGDNTINFGNGLSVVVNNQNFSETGEKFTASVHYAPERTGESASFDFEAYAKQVTDAMTVVEEQMFLVDEVHYQINIEKKLNDAYKNMVNNSSTSSAANVISMLSTAVDDSVSIFRPSAANQQAAFNIQYILATQGTDQARNYSAADLVSSGTNFNSNSVFGILAGQNTNTGSFFS